MQCLPSPKVTIANHKATPPDPRRRKPKRIRNPNASICHEALHLRLQPARLRRAIHTLALAIRPAHVARAVAPGATKLRPPLVNRRFRHGTAHVRAAPDGLAVPERAQVVRAHGGDDAWGGDDALYACCEWRAR